VRKTWITNVLLLALISLPKIAIADHQEIGDTPAVLILWPELGTTLFNEQSYEDLLQIPTRFMHSLFQGSYARPANFATSYAESSQVVADKHYAAEVNAGATHGILSRFHFVTPNKGVTFSPFARNGGYGISFNKIF